MTEAEVDGANEAPEARPELANEPVDPPTPELRRLLTATGFAALIAVIVLLVAVLPAEYGIDPTGLGETMGLLALGEPPEEPPIGNVTTSVPLLRFNASWVESTVLAHEVDGDSTAGASQTIRFDVPLANVTRATAVLSWTDDDVAGQATDPDTFTIDVTPPTGEMRSWTGRNDGAAGSITAPYIITAAPAPVSLVAADEDEAMAQILHWHPGRTEGVGPWAINVSLVEAGDLLAVPDEGNTWNLRVFVTTAELVLGEPEATDIRADTIEVLVPALAGVEYKVFAREGRALDYAWAAPIALYYDFHGVHATGQETSHEAATSASRQDTFIVPFSGRHGWYWQNDSAQDVTVTVQLRGTYTVLP